MVRPRELNGKKNLIAERLVALRKRDKLSQRKLAAKLQLVGMDMDKNVITRIETGKRYVTDIEIRALANIFDVSYEFLIDGPQAFVDEQEKQDQIKTVLLQTVLIFVIMTLFHILSHLLTDSKLFLANFWLAYRQR